MLALSIAVGNLGTRPVSKNSIAKGTPKYMDRDANANDSKEKKRKGRSSLVKSSMVANMRAPSR